MVYGICNKYGKVSTLSMIIKHIQRVFTKRKGWIVINMAKSFQKDNSIVG